ncbi:2933_t:CDS:2, partial [Gigaspora rosea]
MTSSEMEIKTNTEMEIDLTSSQTNIENANLQRFGTGTEDRQPGVEITEAQGTDTEMEDRQLSDKNLSDHVAKGPGKDIKRHFDEERQSKISIGIDKVLRANSELKTEEFDGKKWHKNNILAAFEAMTEKKRLPAKPEELALKEKFEFPIMSTETAIRFIEQIPSFYRVVTPLPREYIGVNYTSLEDLPVNWED